MSFRVLAVSPQRLQGSAPMPLSLRKSPGIVILSVVLFATGLWRIDTYTRRTNCIGNAWDVSVDQRTVDCPLGGSPVRAFRDSRTRGFVFNSLMFTFAAAESWGAFYSDCTARNWESAKGYCSGTGGRLAESVTTSSAAYAALRSTSCTAKPNVLGYWVGGLL